MSIRLEFRQGTATSATSNNPILGAGEPGYETDTGRWKIGDGTTRWNDLDYMGSAADVAAAQAAAQSASDSAAAAAGSEAAAAASATIAAGHRVRALQLRGIPAGFDFDPGFSIYMGPAGFVVPAFNIDVFALTETNVYYVDPVSGSDTTGTGTSAAPYQSLYKAIHGRGNVTVWAKPGLYDRTIGWKGAQPSGRVTVRRWGDSGQIISSAHHAGLSWSLNTGGTYQATIATVGSVVDMANTDAFGFGRRLTLQTSIANVDANPGSYYVNGTTVYVRTVDSRVPDANLRVYAAELNGFNNKNDTTMWLEHCHFHGGSRAFIFADTGTNETQRGYFKDCGFLYSRETYDGLSSTGGGIIYLLRPIAAQNAKDGLNYGANSNAKARKVLEIDATCVNNGYDATDINNGSTAHDGCRVIRVGGYFAGNEGRNVHDVVGCQSWCLGSYAAGSRATGAENGNFGCGTSTDTSKMWLDTCTSEGSTYDTDVSSGSTIYTHELSTDGAATGGGTLTTY